MTFLQMREEGRVYVPVMGIIGMARQRGMTRGQILREIAFAMVTMLHEGGDDLNEVYNVVEVAKASQPVAALAQRGAEA